VIDANHERIAAAGSGISILMHKLKTTTDPSDQRYVLETFSNLSKNDAIKPHLATPELEDILIPFLASTNEPLLNATQMILNNLRMTFSNFLVKVR
jgi:hypothetical protein